MRVHDLPAHALFASTLLALPLHAQRFSATAPRSIDTPISTGVAGKLPKQLGALTVFEADESANSRDLNGDGDMTDQVVQVFDARTRTATSLGVALRKNSGSLEVSDGQIAMAVYESDQGVDLNGDGDLRDQVVHVVNLVTLDATNLGFAVLGTSLTVHSSHVLSFRVSEQEQGMQDLNGDGDALDYVLFLYDASTQVTHSTGLVGTLLDSSPELVAFYATESIEGRDLNGDGDLDDEVLHAYDVAAGTTRNLGRAIFPGARADGTLIAFWVWESREGQDLNGDGDTLDRVLHTIDVATGVTTNYGLAGTNTVYMTLADGELLFSVTESGQGGMDLNGDGDSYDILLHRIELATGALTNLNLEVLNSPLVGETHIAFMVGENSNRVDLNGDGDRSDHVPELLDRSTGVLSSAGLAAWTTPSLMLSADRRRIAFLGYEFGQGSDLNGDGDLGDVVIALLEPGQTTPTLLPRAVERGDVAFDDNRLHFRVSEADEERDLNGDGDQNDLLLQTYDTHRGRAFPTRLDVKSHSLSTRYVTFALLESVVGADLNGDGDLFDLVPHVLRLPR